MSTLLIECKQEFDKNIPASSYKIMSDLGVIDVSPISIEGNGIDVFLNALVIAELHLLNNGQNVMIASFSKEYKYNKSYVENKPHNLINLTDCLSGVDETGAMKLLQKDKVKLSILQFDKNITLKQMYNRYDFKNGYSETHEKDQITIGELNLFSSCDELLSLIKNSLFTNNKAAIVLIDDCIVRQMYCVEEIKK